MSAALAMALALGIDACIGWPDALYARIGHPVTWAGRAIGWADRTFNHGSETRRRVAGILTVAGLVGGVILATALVQTALPDGLVGTLILALLAWPLVAAWSMGEHVRAVLRPLQAGRTDDARAAVAMIVGRDVTRLDDTGISRAALESLAENTSDGITAPLFWGALFGLPGIAGYKMVNTLDSMIGYRTERHRAFGWAAARLDDVVNWIPARLTGALFALLSRHPRAAWEVIRADARHHRSPNAGWPEAAMAGALQVRVSGPRLYDTGPTDDPYVNASAPDPAPRDLARGLALYRRTLWAMGAGLALIGGLALA
ncbi:adenosylcobinamide-phosphate synthase CbiB [Pseudaestuariivita atlantica]|uniref:Cobalamin biosynthesis protein CobD n=1 Tax=Pseudaestuariivita atlantica TaxID=1317121 RepID=A0A0L1JQG1_9RHOB|nr:adenosylcobinamide-phosphate synthase CbiB [Pseudaestuariivita atlantica]KNG94014.1 cobalamin biosynthesis protein CobD [Pseudaestuariivita atlantica]